MTDDAPSPLDRMRAQAAALEREERWLEAADMYAAVMRSFPLTPGAGVVSGGWKT